jgi:hypothetical protein
MAQGDYCLVGVVNGEIETWKANGRYSENEHTTGWDIIMNEL